MALTTTVVNPNQTLAAGGLEGATDDVISAIFWNRAMSLLYYLAGTAGYIGCRAFNSAAISAANSAETLLTFNSERFDSDPNGAIHDNATNPGRFVVRTPGVYHVGCTVEFAAGATGIRYLALRINGVTDIAKHAANAVAGGSLHQLTVTAVYAANASDYFEAYVFQNNGGALNVNAVANNSPEMWCLKA